MLTELALSDGGGLYKWAGATLVLLVTVWWARKQSSATKRSSDPALACGDTFEEGVSFASVLDIPELRKLIERHHDGDREPADPATHDLEDTIQVVHSGASKLSQVVKGWRRSPSEARFLVCGRTTPWSELTLNEALVYIQQQDGEHPPIALDLSAISCGRASNDDGIWHRTDQSISSPLSNDDLLSTFSTRPHLQHLRLESNWVTDTMVKDIATHCTELRSLIIEPGDWAGDCRDCRDIQCDYECTEMITADSLVLANNCTHLRVLRLDLCRFDDAAALVLAENCRGLRVLCLKRGHDGFELGVSDLGVCTIAESCRQLESVELDTCQLTDAALLALARGCPQLKRLSITHTVEHEAYSMTNVAVEALAKLCPQLATLELPGYWHLFEQSCPRLITPPSRGGDGTMRLLQRLLSVDLLSVGQEPGNDPS